MASDHTTPMSEPMAELDSRFSSANASPTPWEEARRHLERAEVYWLTTVRPDGRPHVTPLIAIWLAGALYFCTGPDERKTKNLARNPHSVITTGCNSLSEGLDLVVEGEAKQVADEVRLRQLVEPYSTKYGWTFTVREGALLGDGGMALVFEVAPTNIFAFGKGETYSQTRWQLKRGSA